MLIDGYKEHYTIGRLRNFFREKYGGLYPQLNDVKQLKARFYKILRTAVRRVQAFSQEHSSKVPQLIYLNDDKVKSILRSSDALHVRIQLGELYKKE